MKWRKEINGVVLPNDHKKWIGEKVSNKYLNNAHWNPMAILDNLQQQRQQQR